MSTTNKYLIKGILSSHLVLVRGLLNGSSKGDRLQVVVRPNQINPLDSLDPGKESAEAETAAAAKMVVAYVRRLIESGQFKPGEKLPPEREMTRVIGVSRASVRAGLRSLATVGVVELPDEDPGRQRPQQVVEARGAQEMPDGERHPRQGEIPGPPSADFAIEAAAAGRGQVHLPMQPVSPRAGPLHTHK